MFHALRPQLDRQPRAGALVEVHVDRALAPGNRWRRFIVESFPGPGNRSRWHLCTVRALDNGARFDVSGFFCVPVGEG